MPTRLCQDSDRASHPARPSPGPACLMVQLETNRKQPRGCLPGQSRDAACPAASPVVRRRSALYKRGNPPVCSRDDRKTDAAIPEIWAGATALSASRQNERITKPPAQPIVEQQGSRDNI